MTNLASPQESAWQRGSKLSQSLHNFYRLNYLLVALLMLLGIAILMVTLNGSPRADGLTTGLFVGGALSILLMVGGYAVYLRAIRSAAEAVATVAEYAGRGAALQSDKVLHFVKWLGVWRWVTVAGAVLSVLPLLAGSLLTPLLAGLSHSDAQLSGVLGFMTGLGMLVAALPSVVLTWLILGAIKNFFLAMAQRARGHYVLLGPTANTAAGWLTFTLVVLILGALSSMLGYISIIAGLLLPSMLGSSRGDHLPAPLAALCCLPVVLLAALQIWQIVLVAWSGGFARDAAAALDEQTLTGHSAGGQVVNSDPWAGAVLEEK